MTHYFPRFCALPVLAILHRLCVCTWAVRVYVCVLIQAHKYNLMYIYDRVSPRVQSHIVSLFDYVIKTVSLYIYEGCICLVIQMRHELELVVIDTMSC